MKLALHRGHVAFLHDLTVAALSFLAALYLRLGRLMLPGWDVRLLIAATVVFTLVSGVVFLFSGLYKGVWRYASVHDMMALVRAVTLVVLIFCLAMFLATRLDELPRTVPVIAWFVMLALLGGPRFLYRQFKDGRTARKIAAAGELRVPVLLVGAGDEADLFIRATLAPDAQYRPVGLLAEKNGRVGRNIHGVDVLGCIEDLPQVVDLLRRRGDAPQRLVITDHRLDGAMVRHLLDEADSLGLGLARSPRLTDLQQGVADRLALRPIAVEDLLGRPQTVLDREAMAAMIWGRRVMVTGAGGSIGSELVRQVADLEPALLVLFEACEFNLYSIDLEIAGRHPDLPRQPVLGDVRDARRVAVAMESYRPDLVFHAAALKHVPMVEYNPEEGLLTNAVGTGIVARACRAAGVRLMVLISTDKAVNPTNVMGASKRVAEMVTQSLDLAGSADGAGGTRFVTVRFGNVLGSTGSVVPLFQKQLAQGGPLTVTHPEMTRYFMTVREAVELVLQASAFGLEALSYRGRIFVLDMGEPVKILHLARQMIRLAGLVPEQDIGIAFTGLRPGEKLFEEIFHGAEPPVPTELKGVLVATPRLVDEAELGAALAELEAACRAHRVAEARDILCRLVPEYQPQTPPAQAAPTCASALLSAS